MAVNLTTPLSLSTARILALYAQGLHLPQEQAQAPTHQSILETVQRLGSVQIDTLQMVARSQYLVVWSRLGSYAPAHFDQLAYGQERRIFEGWFHAACLLPLEEYRFQMPHQRYLRGEPATRIQEWLAEQGGEGLLEEALARIRQNGAVRGADFAYDGPQRGSWWDWKPAKYALEHLYATGELMVADRKNFQRVYDLTSRLLPNWVDVKEPSLAERDLHWVEVGVRALGICRPFQAGDYSYRKAQATRKLVEELLKTGVLMEVKAYQMDGEIQDMLVHRDHLPTLEKITDGAIHARRTTFLGPFDSLFWARRRDEQMWGFRQSLEAYLPAPKRKWGYFCLPILHHDGLIGRFDPKLERKTGLLRLKALYLEEGISPDEELVASVAGALRDFMNFHQAKDLAIEMSQPQDFGRKLNQAL